MSYIETTLTYHDSLVVFQDVPLGWIFGSDQKHVSGKKSILSKFSKFYDNFHRLNENDDRATTR